MAHAIFQKHHISPDDFARKNLKTKIFMCASMELIFEEERQLSNSANMAKNGK